MYTVLIVEDEMLVRLGLKNSIDWSKFNMLVIGDASDGRAALALYEAEKPDIVITDIKMPIMDGMELISHIREKDMASRIIILSCIEEFDLLRKAMKLGITGYILKLSMTTKEMEDILLKTKRELDASQPAERHKLNSTAENELIKENFLKNYMFYKSFSDEEFSARVSQMNYQLNAQRLVVCVMEFDHYDELKKKFKDERGELVRYSMSNVFNEILHGYGNGEVFQDEDKRYVFIFSFLDVRSENQVFEQLSEIIEQIRKVMKRFFNISTSFGISSVQNGYNQLTSMYEECIKALMRKFFEGIGKNYFLMDADIESQFNKNRQLEDLFTIALNSILFDELQIARIKVKIAENLEGNIQSREQILHVFFQLMDGIEMELQCLGKERTIQLIQYMDRMKSCEILSDIAIVFEDFISLLKGLLSRKRRYSKGISEVMLYIKRNLKSELSVSELAEAVEITPNYLSNLFKKEVGMNLNNYINSVRVEKAKDLLLNTNMRSYEIAEKVGYRDESYFSRVFMKFYSTRPNELRKLWLSQNSGGDKP
jgi:two-component system response regulator YesN